MKLILQIFILIVAIIFSIIQANSVYKFVKITDTKVYFLKYNKISPFYSEQIKNWTITFKLIQNDKQTEFYCGKLGCFFINNSPKKIIDSGFLLI